VIAFNHFRVKVGGGLFPLTYARPWWMGQEEPWWMGFARGSAPDAGTQHGTESVPGDRAGDDEDEAHQSDEEETPEAESGEHTARFSPPRWLRSLIDTQAGDSVGIVWFAPDEWADLPRMRPSEIPPGNRRVTDAQRAALDEGWDDMLRVGDGPPVYFQGKHQLSMDLWVNTTRPDTLWVGLAGQPTFLWFPAGCTADSLLKAVRPYLPSDLAHPRDHLSTEQLRANYVEAAKGPIPEPPPEHTHYYRLLVGRGMEKFDGEEHNDFDVSFLRTGVIDPRFLMLGSIPDNPRCNPAVTVVRTLYSRSNVRLDWYDELGGTVIAEISYAPATQHETIRTLNKRFGLEFPQDIPVDVPALLLGLEAISASSLRKHMLTQDEAPQTLGAYVDCLAYLTTPDSADYLRPFMNHPDAQVREAVIRHAAELAPELLAEMRATETDPDLQNQIAEALGSAEPPPPKAEAKQPPVPEIPVGPNNPLIAALTAGLGRSRDEPSSDACVLLNPNPRADQAAIIADIAATFPSAPAVTVTQPPGAWGPFFHFGEVTVRTFIFPSPMSQEILAPKYGASWLWPSAKDDLRNHGSMLNLSADGGTTPVDRMVPLTMLAAAFFGTCPQAIGASWDIAGHLIPGRVFRESAARALPAQLPVSLWIGCPVWSNPDGTTSGHTVGLGHFDLPELETIDAPLSVSVLRKRLHKLAERLIAKRPNIRDGAVIGQSTTETLTASYGPSWFGQGERVMRLHHHKTAPPT
jgi:hypothetical protein